MVLMTGLFINLSCLSIAASSSKLNFDHPSASRPKPQQSNRKSKPFATTPEAMGIRVKMSMMIAWLPLYNVLLICTFKSLPKRKNSQKDSIYYAIIVFIWENDANKTCLLNRLKYSNNYWVTTHPVLFAKHQKQLMLFIKEMLAK